MTTRTPVIHALLVSLLALAGAAAAVEPVTVRLAGRDEPVTGYLRNITSSRFLLQGEGTYLEFEADAIVSVDGGDEIPPSAWGDRPLVMSSHYEEVLPGGDVRVHTRITFTNRSSRPVTTTAWGVAPHERARYEGAVAHDDWGNALPLDVVAEGDRRRAVLRFAVPVAPGEASTFAVTQTLPDAAVRDGDAWRYRFDVDFPEDRYFFRKVALPDGAELVEAYDGCETMEVDGRLLVMSQRYYPARTVDPLDIRYRLP